MEKREVCNYCDREAVALYNVPSPTEKTVSGKVCDWDDVYVCEEHEAAIKGSPPYSLDLNFGKYASSQKKP